MIDSDDIRKEIAIKYGFLIDKDDPILAIVMVNEIILQRYVDILNEKNDTNRKAIEMAQQKGIVDAKLTAGRIFTEGSRHINEQASERVRTVMGEVLTQIKKELAASRLEIQVVKKVAVVAALVSCLSAAATMGFWVGMTVY